MTPEMHKGLILLIEDNPDDEALTLRSLKKNGIANPVKVARDGEEAVDYLFDAGNAVPALVLLDLKLPRIPGLDILQRMRADARLRLVPVVILTSSKEDSDLIAGYNLGCNSYIRKPVDFDQFNATIQTLGLYWLVLNEAPPVRV
ncbi:response regulator [Sulfuritalea sp.]|uniref:response regulator n=1 Tax=Sulfuritalea sp. TaxID=2480090 RepID=UPI00286DA805|nr:response regulator [Sulfuritalea sp.]